MRINSETLLNAPTAAPARPSASGTGRVFSLESGNDRINGSIPVWKAATSPQDQVQAALAAPLEQPSPSGLSLNAQDTPPKDDSFGFLDLVDMVNPLQHIPVVGTIYRALTGDEIKPIAQIVGGTAFGGPLGAVGGIANAIVQTETGKDIGGNVMGLVMGEPSSSGTTVADTSDTTLAVANLSYRQPHYND